MRGGTLEMGVDAGCRIRGRPLGRCHTLEPTDGITGPTGGTGASSPAPEATPTLPSPTPSHAGPVSTNQSHELGERCLRPLCGQESHMELNGDLEPRLPTTQTDGGQMPGRCS